MIHHIQSIDKEKFKFFATMVDTLHYNNNVEEHLINLSNKNGNIVIYDIKVANNDLNTLVIWAPVEPIPESDKLKLDLPPDSSALNAEQKKAIAETAMQSAGKLLLTIFYYLDLKTHMAARLHEPSTNEYFELVFRKVDGP